MVKLIAKLLLVIAVFLVTLSVLGPQMGGIEVGLWMVLLASAIATVVRRHRRLRPNVTRPAE